MARHRYRNVTARQHRWQHRWRKQQAALRISMKMVTLAAWHNVIALVAASMARIAPLAWRQTSPALASSIS